MTGQLHGEMMNGNICFFSPQRIAMLEYVAFDDRFREVDRKELD